MNCRKLALVVSVATSCAGCVTETKSVPVSPEMAANIKGLKETEYPKREAQPQTWVAVGDLYEGKAGDQTASPAQHNASLDEARKAYMKAIELDPKCTSAQIHLANLYLRWDDPERAIAVYQRALQQNPKSALLWYEQGMVNGGKKDLSAALPCFAKAHELEPDNRHYATDYGLCLARAGRPQEGVTVLCRVMSKAEANYNVARMMAHINQPELTRQYVQAALRERPTHPGALALLAELGGASNGQTPALGAPQFDFGIDRAAYQSPR